MAAPGGGASAWGGSVLEEECEVVRVRVKKSEGLQPPEFRSFAVDPQITSLDVLQHILRRAFDLQGKKPFSLSFAARDHQGQETFLPLLNDGDLAAAFTCARPLLQLRLDVRGPPDSPLLEDWDIISPREVAAAEPPTERRSLLAAALPFTQALLAQVGRTLARAQAALAWPEGSPPSPPPPPSPWAPLSDADLRSYLGPGGRLLRPHDLRLHVFHAGVEPGLRKVVWRYLLNVFPAGLSGQERLAHLRSKAADYRALQAALAARAAPAELAQVGAAVRKDVVRTDRQHPYFGGPEEGHPHLAALQALLTTFALGHPRLSYCQGMSDVAAPLLAVLDDEAQAFLCFCALMRRMAARFRPGGRGLARAFAHLRRLLRRTDPPFWAFLAARGAHDLLFCYRWLLLELKREFAFDDALRLLEICWSSLPPAPPPPDTGVPLLGAPLGIRQAQQGLRERQGLRPRAPRRRRLQQQRRETPMGSTQEDPQGHGERPERGCSAGDVQGGPRSSGGGHEDPEAFVCPRSSRGGHEDPGGIQEDQQDPRTPQATCGDAEAPGGTQEGPKVLGAGGQISGKAREAPQEAGEALQEAAEALDTQEEAKQDTFSLKNVSGGTALSVGPGEAQEALEELGEHREAAGDPSGASREAGDHTEVTGDPTEVAADPELLGAATEDPWGGRWAWEDSSSSSSGSSSSSEDEVGVEDDGAPLPPPEELGQGNPFVLFVCLAMLLEQREAVMASASDYNEVAMHFDRLVRRHQLPRVLRRAKGLFARYLESCGAQAAVVGGSSA